MSDDQSLQVWFLMIPLSPLSDENLESSFHFALAAMEQRQINSGSSGVLRLFLVQGHVPVSGRVSPQFPHWGELFLLCHSVPFTPLQGFLQYRQITYKTADFIFKTSFCVNMYSLGAFRDPG